MSIPTGNYIIYNRVLSPTGNKLAITFNSIDQGATVNALSEGDPSQQVSFHKINSQATLIAFAVVDNWTAKWRYSAAFSRH